MSDTTGVSGMPLTDGEKTDIRRFCGYPAIGMTASGENSWRFFEVAGALEWRMNNLSLSEVMQVRVFLAQLRAFETALAGASDNLDTAVAAVWTHNARELSDRAALLTLWCDKLCSFLGVANGCVSRRAVAIEI